MVLLDVTTCTNGSATPAVTRAHFHENGTIERKQTLRRAGLLRPVRSIANLVNSTVLQLRDGLTEEQRAVQARKEERRQISSLRMKNADTLEYWANAAKELDVLEENEAWKYELSSSEFDVGLIEARLKQLDEARINCDVKTMLHLVRTELSRDLGRMGNIRLYKHSHIGTKDLIERYIDSTLDTIRSLVETSRRSMPDGLESKDILEKVIYARQAFGRSALLLSGGATFGMNHVGVLKALFEAKLLPRIISGTSAGSIVCAVLCTRTDAEIPGVLEAFPHGDLAVFDEQDQEEGVLDRIRRLLTQGAWIDIKHLTRVMRGMLGDMTFQESYNRSRRILNITVSSASVYELPRLLNYVTAPNVMIWSAVAASCSVPVLFSAAQLLVKNPVTGENSPWNPTPQRWIDGSVDNDLPMTRLAEMFNVNHFIVSQVNPHVVPFLAKDEAAIAADAQSGGEAGPGLVYTLTNLAKDEILHRMHMLAELGIFPNMVTKARSVLSQKYSGDITILPQIDYKDFPRILKNPDADFMVQTCLCGERATWPKLSRIRNRCAVELELDAAVQILRARVVFSPSQVDLRRMTTNATFIPRRLPRRDSGSAIQPLQTHATDDDEENVHNSSMTVPRPPIRTASTQAIRRVPPLFPPNPTNSTHSTPLPFTFPKGRDDLTVQMPDISSAGETAYSAPSSDADDDDSRTDSSTSDPDSAAQENENVAHTVVKMATEAIDYFSASRPVTTGTDRVLATSPRVGRHGALAMESGAARQKDKMRNATVPSNPEPHYKRLFHSPAADARGAL
jgi:TAG lipase/steryl ester hydrolase/phospholipase A2/LPA acyltransferase